MNRVHYPYVPQSVVQNANLPFLLVKFNFCRKKCGTKFLCVKSSSGKIVATSFSYIMLHELIAMFTGSPFQGHFVIRRLGLAMFNPHIKFEMPTITCNEEMKGNAKCKNFRFEPPIGGLIGNVHCSSMARWKSCCRLPIRDN